MDFKSLITTKIGTTSTIAEDGSVEAITLLSATPNTITQIKTDETDGYTAIQLGFEDKNQSKLGKALLGHVKKSKVMPRIIKEVRINELNEEHNVGHQFTADVFSVGDIVDASGVSKGKGWAGTIKRHNFHRGRKTHGGRSYRRPGSIGSMYPQKIFKGKKMAGQMGHENVTVKNLKITIVDVEKNIIGVKGAVPGPKRGTVVLRGVK
ncbi:MAG TPA: 50S ribosomal protein L3 [Candidatus Saccharibacteria bacterium]|nr:50S ribosomal protein L3 [Candidatus Saccharibacteria bacterium]